MLYKVYLWEINLQMNRFVVAMVTRSSIVLQSSAKTKSFSWYYLAVNVGNLVCESGMPVSRQSLGFLITLLLTWSK